MGDSISDLKTVPVSMIGEQLLRDASKKATGADIHSVALLVAHYRAWTDRIESGEIQIKPWIEWAETVLGRFIGDSQTLEEVLRSVGPIPFIPAK